MFAAKTRLNVLLVLEHWFHDNMIVSAAAKHSLFWINKERKSISSKCLQVNVDEDVDDNNDDNFSFPVCSTPYFSAKIVWSKISFFF